MVKRKKVSKTSRKIHKIKSFKPYPEQYPFITYKITEQTFYWFALLSCIFCLYLWLLVIQLDTSRILDTVVATI